MIRVLIVDKPRLICHTIRDVLQKESDIMVVGCATTVEEALTHVFHCNIALVGTTLSNEDTLRLIQEMSSKHPRVKVLVVGVNEVTELILRYVEAGAAGYVLQEDCVEKLLQKIRAAYRDEALVSPHVAARLMARLAELTNRQMSMAAYPQTKMLYLSSLTPREREVLSLIGQGYSNQKIADKLIIEHGTVKNHVHNILKKLNASNRHEAAAVYTMKFKDSQRSAYVY